MKWSQGIWRHNSFERQQQTGTERGSFRSRSRNVELNENHSKALGVIKWNSLLYSTQELLSVYMRLLFYFMYMIILYRRVWKELQAESWPRCEMSGREWEWLWQCPRWELGLLGESQRGVHHGSRGWEEVEWSQILYRLISKNRLPGRGLHRKGPGLELKEQKLGQSPAKWVWSTNVQRPGRKRIWI